MDVRLSMQSVAVSRTFGGHLRHQPGRTTHLIWFSRKRIAGRLHWPYPVGLQRNPEAECRSHLVGTPPIPTIRPNLTMLEAIPHVRRNCHCILQAHAASRQTCHGYIVSTNFSQGVVVIVICWCGLISDVFRVRLSRSWNDLLSCVLFS